jgi:ParB family chromosome partitioning protein
MSKVLNQPRKRAHGASGRPARPATVADFEATARDVAELRIDAIDPNPFQPRRELKPQPLEELMGSIERHGILQPLVVRAAKRPERYELVVGERRLRAAQKLGLATVPCIIAKVPDERLLEVALIENLQRADLDPIEVANAYRTLMEQFGYTQSRLAKRLSIHRLKVTHALRILDLPDCLRENVSRGTLSPGHARVIAGLPGEAAQKALAARIARDSLTVRETELEVARLKQSPKDDPSEKPVRPAYLDQVQDRLREQLGTKVTIYETGSARGRIVIDFRGEREFERLLAMFE